MMIDKYDDYVDVLFDKYEKKVQQYRKRLKEGGASRHSLSLFSKQNLKPQFHSVRKTMSETKLTSMCKHIDKICTCSHYPKICSHGYCINCHMIGIRLIDLKKDLKNYVRHTLQGL